MVSSMINSALMPGKETSRVWEAAQTVGPGVSYDGFQNQGVRGRPEPDCWGLPALQPREQSDTDNDSLLLLRLLLIAHIINLRFKGPGLPWCFLEHPEDPKLCSKSPNASRCSTIWKTFAVPSWYRSLGLATIHFDQCELGQCVDPWSLQGT